MSKVAKGLHCNHCDTTIVSKWRHNFVTCNCEDRENFIFVDGGFDYFRFGWGSNASFTEVEVMVEDEKEELS